MTLKLVAENAKIDIGKLLGVKVKNFVADDIGPGEFSMTGKKLFFTTPEMGIGDDYDTSITITYLNKKGKELTKDFDFIVGDSENTTTSFVGNGGPNDYIYNTKKHVLAYGLDGDDTIKPGTGNDKLFGGAGNDELYGYQGKDQIAGEAGNDVVYAGTDDDVIDGGDGDDVLWSHGGDDRITGGEGIDSFAILTGDGADVIIDFVSGVDKIYFNEARFNESQFAQIATKTTDGTLLTFDAGTTVLLEGFFL